jgi:hypothetical protein
LGQSCTCTGTVYDGDTPPNPLHSVKVEAVNGGKGTKAVYTDKNGDFTITVNGLSQCSDVTVKVTANTLNGVEYSKEEKLDDDPSLPKEIYITDYVSCKCDPITNKHELFLHAPAKGAPRYGRNKHVLKINSSHRKEKRYIAEVKCLQKILDELGFKSGKVSKDYKYKFESNSVCNFVSKYNKSGIYGPDEALAIWLFQNIALNPSSDKGQLLEHKHPRRYTSKAFGSVYVIPREVTGKVRVEAEWGTKILMDVLEKASMDPSVALPKKVTSKGGIVIGDISFPTGGVIKGHKAHQLGVGVDIHMRDICGKFGQVKYTWNDETKVTYKAEETGLHCAYDSDYAEALLKVLAAHPNVQYIFFHDINFLPGGSKRARIKKGASKIQCAYKGKPGKKNYDSSNPCKLQPAKDSHAHHIHLRVVTEK